MTYAFNSDKSKYSIDDMFAVENEVIYNGNVASTNTVSRSKSISKTGYTPLGILGVKIYREDGEHSHGVCVSSAYIDPNDGKIWVRVFNSGSNDRTVEISVNVLYMKVTA